jgi:hypothetical protein
MTFSVQLDTMAAAAAYSFVTDALIRRWMAANPGPEEIRDFMREARQGAKSAHSDNALAPEEELRLVDLMLLKLDELFEKHFPGYA